MEDSDKHDSRIFLISMILSTYWIYNSIGNLDENSLNFIYTVVNMAKEIASRNNNFDINFPQYI